eukprot:CAMPEP_0185025596 /NCGR_PEP_ID=MMETSP1103-20130426/8491_1 /TAXON_ID=36769 /ORGANISM="Paraphysomonas bandaiensis, Strain Caron Lab Isolate" /LENGTH=554 /DNA_ID=CAMNT_0027558833 /DNA_START=228 /DNA_END=1892 /DNA_ORIENTATION=-
MTPEKVRSDMLPYLQTKLMDMDQVILALGRKIGDILSFIGGPEYAHLVVPIIEALCCIEETVVRSAASASACRILAQIDPNAHSTSAQAFISMLKRLCGEEAGEVFYPRVSACQMIDEIYRVAVNSGDRAAVQDIYFGLCRDDMAIVRRAAALAFPKVVKLAEPSAQSAEFLELLKSLSSPDEHQTVRILAVQSYVSYCKTLTESNVMAPVVGEVGPLVKAAVDDNSWKVRLAIVNEYGVFASCFPAEYVTAEIFPSFVHLLQDSEADVRSLACESALAFIEIVGADAFLTEVVPTAVQLSQDATPAVRKALADMCVDVAAKVGPEAVAQHMSDIVVKCLEDEDPSVKLRVLLKVGVLASEVPTLFQRLTPCIKNLYSDENWRVRRQITLAMPSVIKHMGTEFFDDNFRAPFLDTFKDGVAEVRLATATTLPQMCEAGTAAWVFEKIFPTVNSMAEEEYLFRLTMLTALRSLLAADLSERFQGQIVGLLLGAASDVVANVRLAVAIILGEACKRITGETSAAVIAQIKPVLSELENDKDKDVKYFAQESLKHCV